MDTIGILLLILVILIPGATVCATLLGIIHGWDPPYYLLHAHYPHLAKPHLILYSFQILIRLLWLGWCANECGRINAIIVSTCILFCNSYLACIKAIYKRYLCKSTILFHRQLHCINQIGIDIIRLLAGGLLTIGLCLSVCLHSAIISSWGKFPKEIYFIAVVLDIGVSLEIAVMLPLAIKTNELSEHLIRLWKKDLGRIKWKRCYWKRVVKAERSLALYYAYTKFEKTTRANYYSTIVENTVNVMLVTS